MVELFIPRLKHLMSKGFTPDIIYDVGAYKGSWTTTMKEIFPKATYYLFEANPENKSHLEKFDHFIVLLGSEDFKSKTFYSLLKGCTGDSVYKEQTSHYKEAKETEMKTLRLDTVIKTYHLKRPNFLKIDVQGSELDVLKGINSEFLNQCEFIMLETKVLEFNKGSPDLLEILLCMQRLGYQLYDIMELHYIDNELGEVDLLFCKINSKYLLKKFS